LIVDELNILLLEDVPDDAELLLYELRRSGFKYKWNRVDNETEYIASLHKDIDLIVADYSLPNFGAVAALKRLQEMNLDIPLIVVTGTVTEQVVVECMRLGASDYLLKDRLTRLGTAVTHALQEKKLRDEKRMADEALRRYAAELEQRVIERTTELQHSKEYVEAILNHTSDAIILMGEDGNIQHVNPAFERLFGYPISDVLGQSLLLLAGDAQVLELASELQAVYQHNESRRIEINLQRADDVTFAADVSLAPMSGQQKFGGIVCSIWDVSERKRTEENLRTALEKEKELGDLKSRFTSMVSHEFRTPLAVIQSSSDLLKGYADQMTPERRVSQLDKIQNQVKRLTDLLNDILLLSKAQSVGLDFNPEPVDLYAFSQDIVGEMRLTAKTHTIQFNAQGDCFQLNGDTKLLRQAISNLLSNAVKYSPAGSTVSFRLFCGDDQAIMQIQDQGDGISEEDQKHLFETFFRAKSTISVPGTGLGLPIVKQAIEAHGGSVTFESKVGYGTTFTLSVPLQTTSESLKD
jgi:PAS domain S-box-containing protein